MPGAWLDVQVNELQSWHGFGLGLRAALRLARTPLVLVSPHDMEFTSRAHSDCTTHNFEATKKKNFPRTLHTITTGLVPTSSIFVSYYSANP